MIFQSYFSVCNLGIILLGRMRLLSIIVVSALTTIFDVGGVVLIADICSVLINQDFESSVVSRSLHSLIETFFDFPETTLLRVSFLALVSLFFLRTVMNLWFYWLLSIGVFAIREKAEECLLRYTATCEISKIREKTQNEGIRDFITDLNTLASCVRAAAALTVEFAICGALALSLVFLYPYMVLKMVFPLLLFAYLMLLILRQMRSFGSMRRDVEANRYENLLILLGLGMELRIYNVAGRALAEFRKITKKLISLEQLHYFLTFIPRHLVESFAVAVLCGLYFVLDSTLLTGSAPIFIGVVLFRILPSINRVSSALNILAFSQKSLAQLEENIAVARVFSQKQRIEMPRIKNNVKTIAQGGCLGVRKLTAKVGNRKLFEQLDFDFPERGLVVLSGPSGSGKTTFVEILMGLVPRTSEGVCWSGHILNSEKFCYGFVAQNVLLIERNIKENIEFFGPQLDSESVKAILISLGLSELVSEQRFARAISSQGSLSGGERQRIGLARAMARDSDILILDEVTSNLDRVSGLEILKILEEISRDKLVIFITHDLDVMARADLSIEFN